MRQYSLSIYILIFAVTIFLAEIPASAFEYDMQTAKVINDSAIVLIPTLGISQEVNQNAIIDYSHTDQGYIMCKYTGRSDKVVIQISKNTSAKVYSYYLSENIGTFWSFPLTQKDGRYHISIWQRLTQNTYTQVLSTEIDVKLKNEFLPFLYASSIVDFDENSAIAMKGRRLTAKAKSAAEKIDVVLKYISDNVVYDTDKATAMPPGYISIPDETLKSGKGVCVDYAVLAVAMLRSLGIPAKVIYGYTPEGAYHAWISVYTDKWTSYDPLQPTVPTFGYQTNYVY